MKFDNEAEEDFYDFLNDYEITSMIRKIESQVWVKTYGGHRRIDFVLTLTNGSKLYVETDGSYHDYPAVQESDYFRELELNNVGINTTRVKFRDFFTDREMVANQLEGIIDLLGG